MSVMIFFVAGFSIYGQDGPELVWQDQKAIGVSFPEYIPNPIVRVSGQVAEISGKYESVDGRLTFYPIWPFTIKIKYEVWVGGQIKYWFDVPQKGNQKPVTLDIYPQQDTLPENVLKFYLKFSQPMLVGNVYDHISLYDEDGKKVYNVFLELQPELWNLDNTRLTVWFDPGRIKRELVLNEMLGNPLEKHKRYELHISANWKTANGVPLGKECVKTFYSSSGDRRSPNVGDWKFKNPMKSSQGPLSIEFDEPLDYVLSGECITIEKDGQEVLGTMQVSSSGNGCSFIPVGIWRPGEYKILIETRLEDLAGNNLNRLFDVDLLDQKMSKKRDVKVVERMFHVDDHP